MLVTVQTKSQAEMDAITAAVDAEAQNSDGPTRSTLFVDRDACEVFTGLVQQPTGTGALYPFTLWSSSSRNKVPLTKLHNVEVGVVAERDRLAQEELDAVLRCFSRCLRPGRRPDRACTCERVFSVCKYVKSHRSCRVVKSSREGGAKPKVL